MRPEEEMEHEMCSQHAAQLQARIEELEQADRENKLYESQWLARIGELEQALQLSEIVQRALQWVVTPWEQDMLPAGQDMFCQVCGSMVLGKPAHALDIADHGFNLGGHNFHGDCRKMCKFCPAPCICVCHNAPKRKRRVKE